MILGLRRSGDYLQLHPCIPNDWPEFEISYRFGSSIYHIHVKNRGDAGQESNQIIMDDEVLTEASIPLLDDEKTHEIVITLSSRENIAMDNQPADE